MKFITSLSLILGILAFQPAYALVSLAKVIADHMVIQRGEPVNLWGHAAPKEDISVFFKGATYRAQADKQGNWLVTLPAQAASTGHTIKVVGVNTITLSDIAFGDVFLAGGQSNMAYTLEQVISRFPDEKHQKSYPDIRHFKVQRNYNFNGEQRDIKHGKWLQASASTIGQFSAVSWFFAKELAQYRDVPIGIISSNVGASPVESWMSLSALSLFPNAQTLAQQLQNSEFKEQLLAQYKAKRQAWRKANPNKKLPYSINRATQLDFKPTGFYNAMIAPLQPMRFKGVIWYQGESNTNKPNDYAKRFSTLIASWRQLFEQPNLPFMFVQLANFRLPDEQPKDSNWAILRDQQTQVFKTIPHTAMALAIDVGERHDIHPKDKETVGKRLALGARYLAYGEKDVSFVSPMLLSAEVNNNQVLIHLEHIGKGLKVQGNELKGFAIAGQDKQFRWAKASLTTSGVKVWHNDISQPKFVRYAWADNPEQANLFSADGLPATPFEVALP
ncbi:sialate O-acetylesterase [Thalassotalea agarivorans]|uniref:Sialate O-acetylesterase n=2 Tax=Thalassotalea agarivorans TaxID=349064 RepID=A0A1I0GWH1_THASX|nr:sialate O-acetylesterase [Thalassotalea agarivorans]SET75513.1 sialate O-acetylesterase [Thalassotalea agarivorans]